MSAAAPIRAGFLGACPYPVPQGSQVFLRDHARAFVAAGHIAHLITYAHGVGEDTSGLPLHRGVSLPGLRRTQSGPSLAKPLVDALLVGTVRQVVRRERLSVIFAHNCEGLAVALAARACPVIYQPHNLLGDELPHYFTGAAWARWAGNCFDACVPRRAAAVVAAHASLAEALIARGCRASHVHVVPPPIWCESSLYQRVPSGEPAVLYTGNLDPYQNLGLLHAVMARVRAARPSARLCIATAEACASGADEVVPTHDAEALQDVLARDAVFVVPRTAWSGYPVKILNAMAAGLPIVACASAAHGLEHEQTALLVPDGDVEVFAAAILRLLDDPALRRRLGDGAHAMAASRHAPLAVGEALARVARQVIAG